MENPYYKASTPAWNKYQNDLAAQAPRLEAGSGGGGGGGKDNLAALFQGVTAPYNASAPNYGAMPQMQNFPAFMPGQMEGIASQLSQGFGAPQQSYMDQMNQIYRPVGLTQMSEPLTQTMRAWGLKPSGEPGGVSGSISGGYQQYGQQTGSPMLDSMFGLQPSVPAPDAAPVTPALTWDEYRKTYKKGDGTKYPSRMNQSQFNTWQAAPAPATGGII